MRPGGPSQALSAGPRWRAGLCGLCGCRAVGSRGVEPKPGMLVDTFREGSWVVAEPQLPRLPAPPLADHLPAW